MLWVVGPAEKFRSGHSTAGPRVFPERRGSHCRTRIRVLRVSPDDAPFGELRGASQEGRHNLHR